MVRALIKGVWVEGTPEEIERYRELAESNVPPFKISKDSIPDHIKKYKEDSEIYTSSGNEKMRSWY